MLMPQVMMKVMVQTMTSIMKTHTLMTSTGNWLRVTRLDILILFSRRSQVD